MKKYIKSKNSKLNRCDVIENTLRVIHSKDSTLLNSQNVILYDFYKAKKYLPGMVESPFYEVITVTSSKGPLRSLKKYKKMLHCI